MTKYCLCLILFLVVTVKAKAQAFAIKAERMNIAYIGIDNPLTIVSGKCSCDELVVTIGGQSLQRTGPCKYNYRPSMQGKVDVVVGQKTRNGIRVLDTQHLKVKLIPKPQVSIGRRENNDYYPLAQFKVQKGVTVSMENLEMEFHAIVEKFVFKITRNGTLLSSVAVKGPLFNQEVNNAMLLLKPGDVVLIEDIVIVGADVCPRHVADLTYTMK